MKSAIRPLAATSIALMVVQVILWALVGRASLPATIPQLIEMDLREYESSLAEDGHPLPSHPELHVMRICDDLFSRIGDEGVSQISGILGPLNATVLSPGDPPISSDVSESSLCYHVYLNTPLYSRMDYGHFQSWGVTHQVWFVLGFWIPGKATESWVS